MFNHSTNRLFGMTRLIVMFSALVLIVAAWFWFSPEKSDAVLATPHPVIAQTTSDLKWEDMSHKQRKEYMHEVVMPQMRRLFTEFDSTEFGTDMKCRVCHGDGVQDDSFKMPNPKLPKLPNSPEGWGKLKEKKARWMKFMGTVVKPEMAKLLGMPEYDMKTGKGFGCMNCHTSE